MAGLGLAVLRLALAVVLVSHGSAAAFGSSAPELTTAAGIVELVTGVCIGLGLFTRVAAIVLLVTLMYLGWTLNATATFLNWHGTAGPIEQSLLLFGALACLALGGGGQWSVDGFRANTEASRAAGRARLRGKL